jgi:hypothetical protein
VTILINISAKCLKIMIFAIGRDDGQIWKILGHY